MDKPLKSDVGEKMLSEGFPGGPLVKNTSCNARDTSLIPGPGRSHMPWSSYAWAPQLLSPSSGAHTPKAHALQQEKAPH